MTLKSTLSVCVVMPMQLSHKYTYKWCNVNKCTNKFATVGDEHGKKALWETDVTDPDLAKFVKL